MNVKELKEFLDKFDDETEVLMAKQYEGTEPTPQNYIKYWAIDLVLMEERFIKKDGYLGIVARPCRETSDSKKCIVLV